MWAFLIVLFLTLQGCFGPSEKKAVRVDEFDVCRYVLSRDKKHNVCTMLISPAVVPIPCSVIAECFKDIGMKEEAP